jgi:hypothetical protein
MLYVNIFSELGSFYWWWLWTGLVLTGIVLVIASPDNPDTP